MSSKFTKIYAVFCTLCAILLSALRVAVTLYCTDSITGVYSRASILPKILDISTVVLIITVFLIPVIFKNSFPFKTASKQNKPTVFFSALLAFAFLFTSLYNIYQSVISYKNDIATVITSASGILSALFFFARVFAKKSNKGVLAILAFFPIVWSLATLVAQYFDMTILITSPNRAYHQIALLALAAFALTEIRELIGFDNNRLYSSLAGCAGILLSVSALPNLVCPQILAAGETYSVLTYLVEFIFALYCIVRLFNTQENRD